MFRQDVQSAGFLHGSCCFCCQSIELSCSLQDPLATCAYWPFKWDTRMNVVFTLKAHILYKPGLLCGSAEALGPLKGEAIASHLPLFGFLSLSTVPLIHAHAFCYEATQPRGLHHSQHWGWSHFWLPKLTKDWAFFANVFQPWVSLWRQTMG